MAVNTNPPIQLAPGTDASQKDAFINENFRKITDSLNPFQISDGSNSILNIGKDSTGAYSMKVAKPGFNAYDAADANLIFNSNQNTFKIVKTFTITVEAFSITTGGASRFVSDSRYTNVAHGLDYVPAVLAFETTVANQQLAVPYSKYFTGANYTAGWANARCGANATDVGISIELMAASTPTFNSSLAYDGGTFLVYVLQEQSNS